MASLMRRRNSTASRPSTMTVIVSQRDVHHGTDDDLAVHGHGPFLDGVHSQNAGLRRIDDGRGKQ